MDEQRRFASKSLRVVVVGPCASGKSTLVRGLRALGYDAIACGQEHSEIATLWRHAEPDVLIALLVDLATVRRRRGNDWPARLHEVQKHRLAPALASADFVLDSAALDAAALLAAADRCLRECVADRKLEREDNA